MTKTSPPEPRPSTAQLPDKLDVENENTVRVQQYDATIIFDTATGDIYRVTPGETAEPSGTASDVPAEGDETSTATDESAADAEKPTAEEKPPRLRLRYTDIFDATALLFPNGVDFPVTDEHVRVGAAMIDTLRTEGFGPALAALRKLKSDSDIRTVTVDECMHAAEKARTGLERRRYRLGGPRCLERSLGMAGVMLAAGVEVTMTIGVTRYATDLQGEFHAWISHDGEPVAPHREVRDVYATILTV